MNKISKVNKKNNGIKDFISMQLSGIFSKNEVNATNEAIEGMDLLRQAYENKVNVGVELKQGNFFEYIEATKFNIDAAQKGDGIRAVVTESIGKPHDPADILIRENGKILEKVQAKSSKKSSYATNMLTDSKYNDMQKLTNPDRADEVRELARKRMVKGTLKENEYRDTYENVTGELKYKNISSGGTSYNEAIGAAQNTPQYIKDLEMKQFKNEIKTSSINTATTSAIIGGSVSILKNGIEVYKNDKALESAIADITKDTMKSGARGAISGGLASGIRIGAQKLGNNGASNLLSSSTASITLASAMLDVGVSVYSYAKGDINQEELKDKMAEVSIKTISTVYISQAAQVSLGLAPGAFVPIAAYTLSYYVYASCKTVFDNAKLKEEEAEKIISLYNEAIRSLNEQKVEMQEAIQSKLDTNQKIFNKLIESLDTGLSNNNLDKSISALENFALSFGKELKLSAFDEFDRFMLTSETLKL